MGLADLLTVSLWKELVKFHHVDFECVNAGVIAQVLEKKMVAAVASFERSGSLGPANEVAYISKPKFCYSALHSRL
jgi:hypothetical protein